MSPKKDLPSLGGGVCIQTEWGRPEVRSDIYWILGKSLLPTEGREHWKEGKELREIWKSIFL